MTLTFDNFIKTASASYANNDVNSASFVSLNYLINGSSDQNGNVLDVLFNSLRVPGQTDSVYYNDPVTGFAAITLERVVNGITEVVIAYRGTETQTTDGSGYADIFQDIYIAEGSRGTIINQFEQAKSYYQQVIAQLIVDGVDMTKVKISFTGHSLGGALAQYMGALTGYETRTFNAVGVKDLVANILPDYQARGFSNITNYISLGDFVSNSYDQLGTSLFANVYGDILPDQPQAFLTGFIKALANHNDIVFGPNSYTESDFSYSSTPDTLYRMFDFRSKSIQLLQNVPLTPEQLSNIFNFVLGEVSSGSNLSFENLIHSAWSVLNIPFDVTVAMPNLLPIVEYMAAYTLPSEYTPRLITLGQQLAPNQPNVQYGSNLDDVLLVAPGGQTVYGRNGNDVIYSGSGTDVLYGGTGNDTYILSKTSGSDTIEEGVVDPFNPADGFTSGDTLRFTDGIVLADLTFEADADDLFIRNIHTGQLIIVANQFNASNINARIEKYIFSDGLMLTQNQVLSLAITSPEQSNAFGNPTNDTVNFNTYGNNVAFLGAGNDVYSNYDNFYGAFKNTGDHLVYGGLGDDHITLRAYGDHIVYGGDGDDTIDIETFTNQNTTFYSGDGYEQNYPLKGKHVVVAGDGNDRINIGSDDTFTIDAGKGDDYCVIWTGNSNVTMGEGDDYIEYQDEGNNQLNTGTGNDTIGKYFGGNDTIDSGSGNDYIQYWGPLKNNTTQLITAGKGNDVVVGGINNTIYTYNFGDGADIFIEGDFKYSWDKYSNLLVPVPKSYSGSVQNDNYAGGTDKITFGQGITLSNTLFFKNGDDLFIQFVNSTSDKITVKDFFLGEGRRIESFVFFDGTILNWQNILLPSFTNDADNTNNTGFGNVYNLLAGNDTFNKVIALGNDTINGGAGFDTADYSTINKDKTLLLSGGLGNRTVQMDPPDFVDTLTGIEQLMAGYGSNTINALGLVDDSLTVNLQTNTLVVPGVDITHISGFNHVVGSNNNDNLTGNDLANLLMGNSGADTMKGGLGDDTYGVDSITDMIVEKVAQGVDTVLSDITYTLGNNLENLILTGTADINGTGNGLMNRLEGNNGNNILTALGSNDVLFGQAGNDTLYAGNGADTVWGGIGTDALFGEAGNDQLDGGIGADTMTGGIGSDMFVVDNENDLVIENQAEGSDTVLASINYSLVSYVEHLTLTGLANLTGTGNALANTLMGNQGNNVIAGLEGADTLFGNQGDDTLQGGAGADSLSGDEGQDLLLGDAGNDLLDGGTGNDTLQGGAGNDTYYYNRGSGMDILVESAGANDGLKLVDITKSDVKFAFNGIDLKVSYNSNTATDVLTLKNQNIASSKVESIVAADGSTVSVNSVISLINSYASSQGVSASTLNLDNVGLQTYLLNTLAWA